jgi:hypothetical protein
MKSHILKIHNVNFNVQTKETNLVRIENTFIKIIMSQVNSKKLYLNQFMKVKKIAK